MAPFRKTQDSNCSWILFPLRIQHQAKAMMQRTKPMVASRSEQTRHEANNSRIGTITKMVQNESVLLDISSNLNGVRNKVGVLSTGPGVSLELGDTCRKLKVELAPVVTWSSVANDLLLCPRIPPPQCLRASSFLSV